jgi:hypothetical protein
VLYLFAQKWLLQSAILSADDCAGMPTFCSWSAGCNSCAFLACFKLCCKLALLGAALGRRCDDISTCALPAAASECTAKAATIVLLLAHLAMV